MSFDINKDLDIILITYNRVDKLKEIVSDILDENSPIKNCNITFLDNCSTDGTSEFLSELAKQKKNITHIRHKVNIGGNANIVRALEYANKKYFWILCDDDILSWEYWDEILYGMENDYDAVIVEKKIDIPSDKDYHLIINTLAFLSAAIYKTSNITDEVISNAYINIQNGFPHLVIGIYLLNNNKQFYIPIHTILEQRINDNFTRGFDKFIHPRQKSFNVLVGYINSFQMISNKKIRYKCCDTLCLGSSFYFSVKVFFNTKPFSLYNLSDFFLGVNFKQKIIILYLLFTKKILNQIIGFEVNYEKIKIKIFFITFVIKRRSKK